MTAKFTGDQQKAAFRAVKAKLAEDIEVNDILQHFRSKNILTERNYEEISRQVGREDRFEMFSQKILSRPGWWPILIEALENNLQPHLVKLLNDALAGDADRHNGASQTFLEARQYLKDLYINDCEIMRNHWSKLMDYPEEFDMARMYIELEIMKGGVRTTEKISSYKELFGAEDGERTKRKIILEGDPGMGKSTYVHRLVQQWAMDKPKDKDKEWSEGHQWLNQEFELVILVKLGELTSAQTLNNVFSHYLSKTFANSLANFLNDSANHRKILMVFDAFDEMKPNGYFQALIRHRIADSDLSVKNVTFLISSRISHSNKEALKEDRDFLIRTHGLQPEAVKLHFSHFSNKISNFEALTEQHDQVTLYRNPLFVGMAVFLGYIPEELFDLMDQFCLKVVERYLVVRARRKFEPDQTILTDHWNQVKDVLGKLAFLKLGRKIHNKTNNQEFVDSLIAQLDKKCHEYISTLSPKKVSLCCEVGLLWPKKQGYQMKETKSNTVFEVIMNVFWPKKTETRKNCAAAIEDHSFPHQLFIEFFAAAAAAELGLAESLINGRIYSSDASPLTHAAFMESSTPFDYFLTAMSTSWKRFILQGYITPTRLEQGCVEIRIPWIYNARQLPDLPTNSVLQANKISYITGIKSPAPNSVVFLKTAMEKYNLIIGPTLTIAYFTFNESSIEILRMASETKSLLVKQCRLLRGAVVSKMILLHLPNLREFIFDAVESGQDRLFGFFAEMLSAKNQPNSSLVRLTLKGCYVGEYSMQPLPIFYVGEFNPLPIMPVSLQYLDLAINKICGSALNDLSQYLSTSALTELRIWGSVSGDIGQHAAFYTALPRTLTYLAIKDCSLEEKSVHALSQYLNEAPMLKKLEVMGSEIVSAPEFIAACESHKETWGTNACEYDKQTWNKYCNLSVAAGYFVTDPDLAIPTVEEDQTDM